MVRIIDISSNFGRYWSSKTTETNTQIKNAIFEYKENYQNDVIPAYTPWSKLGLYYFNRVYDGDGKRPGDFGDFLTLINKIESLVNEINEKEVLQIFE